MKGGNDKLIGTYYSTDDEIQVFHQVRVYSNNKIEIYKRIDNAEFIDIEEKYDTYLFKTIDNFEDKFFGLNKKEKRNSILVKLDKHNYIYIDEEIYKFKTIDEIKDFATIIENNLPQSIAFGSHSTYYLNSKKYITNKNLESAGFTINKKNISSLSGAFYDFKIEINMEKNWIGKLVSNHKWISKILGEGTLIEKEKNIPINLPKHEIKTIDF